MVFNYTRQVSGGDAVYKLTDYDPATSSHRFVDQDLTDSGMVPQMQADYDNNLKLKVVDKWGVQIGAYPRPRP